MPSCIHRMMSYPNNFAIATSASLYEIAPEKPKMTPAACWGRHRFICRLLLLDSRASQQNSSRGRTLTTGHLRRANAYSRARPSPSRSTPVDSARVGSPRRSPAPASRCLPQPRVGSEPNPAGLYTTASYFSVHSWSKSSASLSVMVAAGNGNDGDHTLLQGFRIGK